VQLNVFGQEFLDEVSAALPDNLLVVAAHNGFVGFG
jgi:hypothetical protein